MLVAREQVEETLALRELAQPRARRAVIEEQTRVEVIVEVHPQLQAVLFDDVEAELLGDLLIPIAARSAFVSCARGCAPVERP